MTKLEQMIKLGPYAAVGDIPALLAVAQAAQKMMAILGDDEDDGTHWIACARVTRGEECDCYLAVRAALAPLLEPVGEPK